MTRKLFFIVIALIANSISGYAQNAALRIGMPSPSAAALGKFGEVPANLYTGKPNISIAIYELKSRALSVSISLSYDASGVKVEEGAGWVGLNWSLNAGGVITRTVRGLPDEISEGYYNTGDQVIPTPSQAYLDSVDKEQADSLPDLFFFNFAGRSGQFVLGFGDTIRTMPHQKIRIVPSISGGPPEITKWEVYIEDGTRFVFSDTEKTIERPSSISGYEPENGATRSFYTSWYLSKIYSAVGQDSIEFKYEDPGALVVKNLRAYQETQTLVPDVGIVIGPTDSIKIKNNYDVDTIYRRPACLFPVEIHPVSSRYHRFYQRKSERYQRGF